jgi:hypothetical protein
MSTSCCFPMQLRSPLRHRRQCWCLTSSNINTSTTKHSQIRTRKIDRCQRCVALQCRSNRFATNGIDRTIPYSHASANGKHKRAFETLTAKIDQCQRRVALQRLCNRVRAIVINVVPYQHKNPHVNMHTTKHSQILT